jgi:hypothetical protein
MGAGEDPEERLLLCGVERESPLCGPGEERFESVVALPAERGETEAGRHGPPTVPHLLA